MADLHGPQVAIAGELLVEPAAPPAVDATVHFVLDKASQELVPVSPLQAPVAPEPVASGIVVKTVLHLEGGGLVCSQMKTEPQPFQRSSLRQLPGFPKWR